MLAAPRPEQTGIPGATVADLYGAGRLDDPVAVAGLRDRCAPSAEGPTEEAPRERSTLPQSTLNEAVLLYDSGRVEVPLPHPLVGLAPACSWFLALFLPWGPR